MPTNPNRLFSLFRGQITGVEDRGVRRWWQPVLFQLPDKPPLEPRSNAVYFDPETKQLRVWHAGEGKWYQSVAMTAVDA